LLGFDDERAQSADHRHQFVLFLLRHLEPVQGGHQVSGDQVEVGIADLRTLVGIGHRPPQVVAGTTGRIADEFYGVLAQAPARIRAQAAEELLQLGSLNSESANSVRTAEMAS
jgi:hypothetical protein